MSVDPSRQIPEGLSDTDRIFGYSQAEIVTVVVCFFGAMVLTSFLPPGMDDFGIFILVGGLVVGAFVVFVTPNHLEPTEWIGSMGHYIRRPTHVPHLSLDDGMAREQKDHVTEAKIYELNERTQEITWVKKIHREAGAIERVDGALVGAVKVDSANLALASGQKWERLINEWQGYLDHTIEYPVQIFATSKPFPVDDYVDHYQRRINDADIQKRPILQELLRDFLDWYPEYLQYQGTFQKEYYLIFTVKENEVLGSNRQEKSVTEQLMDAPVIGDKIEQFASSQQETTEDEVRAKMIAELNRRIREARNQGIRPLPGCSSRRLTGFELAVLLKEYWEGREVEFDDELALPEQPVSVRAGDPVSPEETATDTGYAGSSSDNV